MIAFEAVVVWPGKDFDDKYGGGQRTSSTFKAIESGKEYKVNSSNPTSDKALLLKSLKKGQKVWLVHAGNAKPKEEGKKPIPYFDVLHFMGAGLSPAEKDPEKEDAKLQQTIDERVQIYVSTYIALQQAFNKDDGPPGVDQISMFAASIAKQISY